MTRTPQEIRAIHDDADLASARGQLVTVRRIVAEYLEVAREARVTHPHVTREKVLHACHRVQPHLDEAVMLVRRANEGR